MIHLQAIHRHFFQDVYEWAGETRTIGLQKAEPVLDGASVNYPHPSAPFPPDNLPIRAEYAFKQLASDGFLKNLSRDEFVDRFAKHTVEIWEVHPFRDGNTRATMTLMRQLAKEAGHELVRKMAGSPKNVRDALVRASGLGDYEPLKEMVVRAGEAHDRFRKCGGLTEKRQRRKATQDLDATAKAIAGIKDPDSRAEAERLFEQLQARQTKPGTVKRRAKNRSRRRRGVQRDYGEDYDR